MTAIMTTLMPFYEEIMTVFCTSNMSNNIKYGVSSHYPSTSGRATAKSLEGMVIWMGFTIGTRSISQWRGCTEVDQELCKRGFPSMV